MRKLILLFTITIFSLSGFSQDNIDCFKIIDNKLVWQEIFESPISFDEIIMALKESGIAENLEASDTKIIGDLKPIRSDYEAAGFGYMVTPIYISRYTTTGHFKIDHKEGRYRVTIKKMIITNQVKDPFTQVGETSELDYFALRKKKTKFTSHFTNKGSKILNYTFSKLFTFIKDSDDEEW